MPASSRNEWADNLRPDRGPSQRGSDNQVGWPGVGDSAAMLRFRAVDHRARLVAVAPGDPVPHARRATRSAPADKRPALSFLEREPRPPPAALQRRPVELANRAR